jgi:anti-sigma factor RsiW
MDMAGETHARSASGSPCDRARQWSSLRVDGELSELEDALLEKHLDTCEECLAFDAGLRSTATVMRAAPVEAARLRVELPSRPRVSFPVGRRVAVAAISVASAAGSIVGSTLQRPAAPPQKPAPQVAVLTRDQDLLRQLPHSRQVTPLVPAQERGGPPEGII